MTLSETNYKDSRATREKTMDKLTSLASEQQGIKILYIQMQFCDGETLEDFLQ